MQTRLRTIALAIAMGAFAPLTLAACNGSSNPAAASEARTVASMLPKITSSLTPAGAEAAFGKPDETTGSGLLIYVYNAEAGKKVYLSFPGYAPIVSARAVDPSGAVEVLTIRDSR
jgi:hypothetical protein